MRVRCGARAPSAPERPSVGSSSLPGNGKRWNFSKADFKQLYYLILLIDWSEMYTLRDVDQILDLFYEKIYNCFDECIPLKRNRVVNKRYVYPTWYTADVIRYIKLKHEYHKRFKCTNSRSDYAEFSRYRAIVKMETERAHDRYRDRVQGHLESNPKAFWEYVRARKGKSESKKILKNGRVMSDDECAGEFANFFQAVYNPDPPLLDAKVASRAAAGTETGAWTHLGPVKVADVRKALARLPQKRSAGPDCIPPFIFGDCRAVLAEPLLYIFNHCIISATFPARWKLSRVVPVTKGGGGTTPSDFRPVAILCAPAKVFEAVIHACLYPQISAHLSDAQHGFRPGRGTTGNLMDLMTRLVPVVDAGHQVDVAYFDFRKAFDTVDNDVLLCKLAHVGCTLHTLAFFANYLRDRRQFVDCNGHYSLPYPTRSGVSQGSNLGPLLFIIMINDLPNVLKTCTPLLFADDLKLVYEIRNESDCDSLQQDIDMVFEWSINNKLHFNVSKCSVLSFSRSRSPIHHLYRMSGEPLQRVGEVRDLGVRFTADLNFRVHITNVCKKAFRNLGLILRLGNRFTNISALRALYDALVRSHLECNSVIWSPHEAKYKFAIERIQNKFLRFVYWKQHGVYPGYPLLYPTLFLLGMGGYYKLEVRREVAVVMYLLGTLRGAIYNPRVLEMARLSVPDEYVGRRRLPPLLEVPRARTNILNLAPLTRATRVLNDMAAQNDLFSATLSELTRLAYSNTVIVTTPSN
jgi:hypothetical protein